MFVVEQQRACLSEKGAARSGLRKLATSQELKDRWCAHRFNWAGKPWRSLFDYGDGSDHNFKLSSSIDQMRLFRDNKWKFMFSWPEGCENVAFSLKYIIRLSLVSEHPPLWFVFGGFWREHFSVGENKILTDIRSFSEFIKFMRLRQMLFSMTEISIYY